MDIDVNKPLENPQLKELFAELGKVRSEEEYGMAMNLLANGIVHNARFLSVIRLDREPEENGDGTATFGEDTTIGFPMLATQDDKKFYPAFLDWEELGKWEAVCETTPRTLILGFDDYAAMVLDQGNGDGMVLDPFGQCLILDRETMEQWRSVKGGGKTECRVEKETAVRLGEPKEPPTELMNAMSAQAAGMEVSALWLRLMEREGELSYLVVADFRGERSTVFDALAGAARPYLHGTNLDMVPHSESFGRQAVDGVEPFYCR
ncbi:MAG: enhanced serine sensitivity protein SseB [Clostridia bacterium]|nr:enhanced serine sensitivity protein SseB [Clostridia bacterium]